MCEYMILEDYKMEQYIYNEQTVFGMSSGAIIISPAWNYQPKKQNGLSAYGGSGICSISVSIKRRFIPAF